MQSTFDTGISKRLGIMLFVLIALLVAFHLFGLSGVSLAASGSVRI